MGSLSLFPKTIYLNRISLLVCGGFAVLASPVLADQVVAKGTSYAGAKVLGFEEGQLQFRAADGRLRTQWVNDIDLLVVDRGGVFDDFNLAERFLQAGEFEKAAVRYERALRLSDEFWPDLAAARLVMAYDRIGQLDKATMNFIRVVRGRFAGPPTAARLVPQTIPPKRDAKFSRAVEQLEDALDFDPGETHRALFKILRYEILRRVEDERAAKMAPIVSALVIPEAVRSERVFAVVLAALRETLQSGVTTERLAYLDRAVRDCPDASLSGFMLLKGETLLRTAVAREDIIRASWPFLRVVVHMPDDPRAADGLLGAASAVERLGRTDQAIALVEECLAHKRLSDESRGKAQSMLARLRSTNATP